MERSPSPEIVARLVASHADFLSFLTRRVPSRAIAEEILQAAFVTSLEKGGSLRDDESAVAWFYRLLRNALIDHYRRRAAEGRALEVETREAETTTELEIKAAVCQCMQTLLPSLKPEHAEVLRRIDLDEEPSAAVAASLGITPGNLNVRLHRARQSLKRQLEKSCGTCTAHGCLDCTCGKPSAGGPR